MSQNATINTTTGNHSVDPYKTQNLEDPPLAQKVQELVDFITQVKFGMLTTKQSEGDYLASRCMALAATVCEPTTPLSIKQTLYQTNYINTTGRYIHHRKIKSIPKGQKLIY
jgi:hypothetical protein